jgi:glycosyltransferase involved in cell wall biosynthesis
VKIVHVITRLNVGGAALSVLELAAEQRRRGHEVLVVSGRIPAGEASMEYLVDDLDVPWLRLARLQRNVAPGDDLRTIETLRKLIRTRRPDVLHTHTAKAGTTARLAALAAGRARPPVVAHTFHGHVLSGYFDSKREQVYRAIERALAHASDVLVAVSPLVRDDLVRFGVAPESKFAVVPYGFDLDRRLSVPAGERAERRAQLGVDEDAFVIGWAGRMTQIKNPLDLVRVIAEVDGTQLVLVGDGELRPAVDQLVDELNVRDRVHLLGYVSDIASWYTAFDAFLLTSGNEGAPVVAIEAQAAGVPVVATDAGGTRSVVEDGVTGFVRAIGDIAALAKALETLRTDRALRTRLGAAGAELMRKRFSIGRMADEIDAVYASNRRR